MDIPTSSLSNQHIQKKKEFPFQLGFVLLFIISVGFNIYFLYFDQEKEVVASLPQAQEEKLQDVTDLLQPEVLKKEIVPPVVEAVIQPTSLTVSSDETLEGKTVYSISFQIRSSLNQTVCNVITREKGCAALSAHLGRLMVWFMDINKSMRNGDYLDVVYQRPEGPEQFKILKLSYKSKLFGKTFETFYFEDFDPGSGGYFDNDGKEIAQRIVILKLLPYLEIFVRE
jgi:murein DD-endopeptidase